MRLDAAAPRVSPVAGYAQLCTCEDVSQSASGPLPHSATRLLTWLIVGSVPDVMADAPYTGADVRAEPFPATPGASFGGLLFVGATRPA
jgi:hypothetical protein